MMKILKNASGPKILKMSRVDWFKIGRKAGWIKKSEEGYDIIDDETWDLDDSFGEASEVIPSIRYETTIDYGVETDIPVTIVYDYTQPSADTDWVPLVEIIDILDKGGTSVQNEIYSLEPNFKVDIEQDLIANGEQVVEEREERETIHPSRYEGEEEEVPGPSDIVTDYGFKNTPMITDRERIL